MYAQLDNRHASSLRRRRGVTLVEMLVALLVISIGLLGLAGLQNVSLQYNHSSYLRTNANNLAYDIADRMRANRDAARNGQYNISFGATPSGGGVVGNDLQEWISAIETTLPDGQGEIEVQGDDRITTIRIRWLDNRNAEDTDAENGLVTFTLRTRL